MKRNNLLIVSAVAVVLLAGCTAWERTPEQTNERAELLLKQTQEAIVKAETAAATQPTTDPELIKIIADLKVKMGKLETVNSTVVSPVVPGGDVATQVISSFPILGPWAGLIGMIGVGAWGELQRRRKQDAQEGEISAVEQAKAEFEKRLRQISELVATVQVAGGLDTTAKELAAMKIQSEDTIADVRAVKPEAVKVVKAVV